jgi:hypothetical protein
MAIPLTNTWVAGNTYDATAINNVASAINALGAPVVNGNTSRQSQATASGTAYYIAGSALTTPTTPQVAMSTATRYRWTISMDKTAGTSTGAFAIIIYRGTNGSTADTADVTQTIGTATAAVDNMTVDVELAVTTTGATGAYYWSIIPQNKAVTGTGFGVATGTGAYFSGTVSSVAMNTASLKLGLGFKYTTGTATITIPLVRATAINIA